MNFSEALGYSLKGQNIPKILTIVLVSIIAGVSVLVAGLALQSWAILLLLLPVLLAYALFVQGYMISVIKSVMNGESTLPAFDIGRDFIRGLYVILAGIVYSLPLIAFFVCGIMLVSFATGGMSSASSDDVGGAAIAMFCVMGLVSLFIIFVVSYSLIIGQIRYATEDSAGALFDVSKNFSTVMSNLGPTFGLFFRMFGVGIVFGIVSNILVNIVGAFFGGVVSDLSYAAYGGNYEAIASLGMPLAIYVSLTYAISLTIGLMQNFSVAHLIAGYGTDLGFGPDKWKNSDF